MSRPSSSSGAVRSGVGRLGGLDEQRGDDLRDAADKDREQRQDREQERTPLEQPVPGPVPAPGRAHGERAEDARHEGDAGESHARDHVGDPEGDDEPEGHDRDDDRPAKHEPGPARPGGLRRLHGDLDSAVHGARRPAPSSRGSRPSWPCRRGRARPPARRIQYIGPDRDQRLDEVRVQERALGVDRAPHEALRDAARPTSRRRRGGSRTSPSQKCASAMRFDQSGVPKRRGTIQ